MMVNKLSLLFLLLASAEAFDITKLPEAVGKALGIGTFGGQMLLSVVIFVGFIIPIAIFGKGNIYLQIAGSVLILAFLVAIGWLNIGIFIIIVLAIALMWSMKVRDVFGGRGGE